MDMPDNKITQETLLDLIDYDKDTGFVYWKTRPLKYFENEKKRDWWNRKYAGKKVGAIGWDGYIHCNIFKRHFIVHRLIWVLVYGIEPNKIDHINGIRHDNRIANLRNVSESENAQNTGISKRNKSGVLGVSWATKYGWWQVTIGGKYVGISKDLDEAIAMRKLAERDAGYHENHGQKRRHYDRP